MPTSYEPITESDPPAPPALAIMSLPQAKRHKRKFDAVLTFENPGQRNGLRFHKSPRPDHLLLRCEDLDVLYQGIVTPTERDVADTLDFGRKHLGASLLIHCNAGVARSTAAALAILCDRLGPGREQEALDEMLRLRPIAVPNLLMVQHTDNLLGRGGALVACVDAWDSVLPDNRFRRTANFAAHVGDKDLFNTTMRQWGIAMRGQRGGRPDLLEPSSPRP